MIHISQIARSYFISGFFLFNLFFLLIPQNELVTEERKYYIPKTFVFSASAGVHYDNTRELRSFYDEVMNSETLKDYSYTFGLKTKFNHIFDFFHFEQTMLSLDYKITSNRIIQDESSKINLLNKFLFFEYTTFESFLKKTTIHPLLGLGLSFSQLTIESVEPYFENEFGLKSSKYELSKLILLLKIGGGFDLRLNLQSKEKELINLISSFDVSYSLSLNFLGLTKKAWIINEKSYWNGQEYYSPGLLLELSVGLEYQSKE